MMPLRGFPEESSNCTAIRYAKGGQERRDLGGDIVNVGNGSSKRRPRPQANVSATDHHTSPIKGQIRTCIET